MKNTISLLTLIVLSIFLYTGCSKKEEIKQAETLKQKDFSNPVPRSNRSARVVGNIEYYFTESGYVSAPASLGFTKQITLVVKNISSVDQNFNLRISSNQENVPGSPNCFALKSIDSNNLPYSYTTISSNYSFTWILQERAHRLGIGQSRSLKFTVTAAGSCVEGPWGVSLLVSNTYTPLNHTNDYVYFIKNIHM